MLTNEPKQAETSSTEEILKHPKLAKIDEALITLTDINSLIALATAINSFSFDSNLPLEETCIVAVTATIFTIFYRMYIFQQLRLDSSETLSTSEHEEKAALNLSQEIELQQNKEDVLISRLNDKIDLLYIEGSSNPEQ